MTNLFRNIIFEYIFRNIISLHCNYSVKFTMLYIFLQKCIMYIILFFLLLFLVKYKNLCINLNNGLLDLNNTSFLFLIITFTPYITH